jgi:hypothetical protein
MERRRGYVRISDGCRCWLAAITTALLAACSNGRGSLSEAPSAPVNEGPPTPSPPPAPPPEPPPSPPPEPPPASPPDPPPTPTGSALAGYWLGRAVERDSERSRDVVALIDHGGEAQLMVLAAESDGDDDDEDEDDADRGDFVLHGNLCCGASFDGDMAGKRFLDDRNEVGKVDIALAGGSLIGEIELQKNRYTVRLTSSAEYGQSLTLQGLAGVYTQSRPLSGATMTLTIDVNGRLTGSNANGCTFNGGVSIPNPERNMVRLQVQMSGCGSSIFSEKQWNGSYGGLGLLLRNAVSPDNASVRQDVFYHSVIGPTWLGPQSVGR